MREQLEQYIKTELKTLKYKGDSVKLKNVYPSLLENILGDFTPYDVNGYDCDYWANTDEYEISGCMRFGTAEITLTVGNEKPEDSSVETEKVEPQEPLILRMEDVSEDLLLKLQTFYFTFGSGQRNDGHFQPIMAKDESVARRKMHEIYGTKWSFMYDEEKWKDVGKYYIGKGLKVIVAL